MSTIASVQSSIINANKGFVHNNSEKKEANPAEKSPFAPPVQDNYSPSEEAAAFLAEMEETINQRILMGEMEEEEEAHQILLDDPNLVASNEETPAEEAVEDALAEDGLALDDLLDDLIDDAVEGDETTDGVEDTDGVEGDEAVDGVEGEEGADSEEDTQEEDASAETTTPRESVHGWISSHSEEDLISMKMALLGNQMTAWETTASLFDQMGSNQATNLFEDLSYYTGYSSGNQVTDEDLSGYNLSDSLLNSMTPEDLSALLAALGGTTSSDTTTDSTTEGETTEEGAEDTAADETVEAIQD